MSDKQYDIKVEGKQNTFEGGAIRYIKDKGRFDLVQPIVLDEMIKHISAKKKHNVSPLELIQSIYSGNYVNAIINITYLHYSNNKKLNKFYNPESGSYNLLMDTESIDREEIMKYFLIMLKYLAIHFQKGAEKYGERNCEKGIPLSSFYDSATRHTYQFLLGETDEPHHISAIWNCWLAIWTIKTHPERCNDFANMYYSRLYKAPELKSTDCQKKTDVQKDTSKDEKEPNNPAAIKINLLKRRIPSASNHTISEIMDVISLKNIDPDEEKELKAFSEMIKKLAESHTFNFNK